MKNERFIDKVKEVIDHLMSNESQIKFLSFCCVIIIALLILIAGLLSNLYNRFCSFMQLIEYGEYTKVSQVYTESYSPGDVLPIIDVISTTETTNNEDTTTNNQSSEKDYIMNTSNKKIHKPDCSYVDRMNDENKKSVKLDDEKLNQHLNDGYTLCNTCCGGK